MSKEKTNHMLKLTTNSLTKVDMRFLDTHCGSTCSTLGIYPLKLVDQTKDPSTGEYSFPFSRALTVLCIIGHIHPPRFVQITFINPTSAVGHYAWVTRRRCSITGSFW